MRAMIHDRYGDADDLRLADLERPTPGRGEVLVRVHAAGVHIGDARLLAGRPAIVRLGYGLRAPRQRVRGEALAGVVEAVGPGVTDVAVGDEVLGAGTGAHAEFALARADRLVPRPATLDWVSAAAVPTSAVTAFQALHDVGQVRAGQRVLLIGATGAVGSFVTQLAVAMGAHVTAVCSARNVEFARSLGAHEVIDYGQRDPSEPNGTAPYDVIIDMVGTLALGRLRRVLTDEGTLVLVGVADGRWLGGVGRLLQASVLSRFTRQRLRPMLSIDTRDALAGVLEHVAAGTVRPIIEGVFPLERLPEAIRLVGSGHGRGKVVVRIRD